MADILRMTGITKQFGSVIALRDVDFDVGEGEIHALLGVNGAGKSTLVKIISGLYVADRGTIWVAGQERSIQSPRDAINCGIAAVQQHPELVGDLSGYENIFLGQEGERERHGLFDPVNRKAMRARAEKLLERFPIEIDLSTKISNMESVERETVAILHALKQEHVKLLILDEPTSTLTHLEAEKLFEVMRTLKASGIGIVYITHRLQEVFEIADRVTIFRDGQKVASLDTADAAHDEASVSRLMLQEEMGELYPAKAPDVATPPILEVRNLTVSGALEGANFTLRHGEIVGGFGLVGSGIEVLAKTLFGAQRPDEGEILLNGRPLALKGPKDALRKGIFLVPGDRKTEGLTLTKSVTFNATLANLGRASYPGGLLKRRRNDAVVAEILQLLDLRPPQLWRRASEFSGGNQQKVVLAKGLFREAKVYVFVEPTVGVDIGARSKLYALIRDLSKNAAILLLSSDFDEVCGLADRVFSLYRGRMSVPPSRDLPRDQILAGGLMGGQQ